MKIDWNKFIEIEMYIFIGTFFLGLIGLIIVENSKWYEALFVSIGTFLLTIPVILIVSSDLKKQLELSQKKSTATGGKNGK